MRVLLIDRCSAVARIATSLLQPYVDRVDNAGANDEALRLSQRYEHDVLVVTLDRSNGAGYEVIKLLRRAQISTPVLVLSSHAEPQAKVRAFAVGADDFVTQPFDVEELLARIRALLRRSRTSGRTNISIGPLMLDNKSGEATVYGSALRLTAKEYHILELLAHRRGQPVSKHGMLTHLYGSKDAPGIKIIEVFVCKLRKKLADAGAENLIATVWGRGYTFREEGSYTPVRSVTSAVRLSSQTQCLVATDELHRTAPEQRKTVPEGAA